MVGHGWPWLAMVAHGWPWPAMVGDGGPFLFFSFFYRHTMKMTHVNERTTMQGHGQAWLAMAGHGRPCSSFAGSSFCWLKFLFGSSFLAQVLSWKPCGSGLDPSLGQAPGTKRCTLHALPVAPTRFHTMVTEEKPSLSRCDQKMHGVVLLRRSLPT